MRTKRIPFKRNIAAKVVGDKLFLVVDLSKNYGPSKSGKTTIVASTLGVAGVPGHEGVRVGLNVFRK